MMKKRYYGTSQSKNVEIWKCGTFARVHACRFHTSEKISGNMELLTRKSIHYYLGKQIKK